MRTLVKRTLTTEQLSELSALAEAARTPEVSSLIIGVTDALQNGELVLAADSDQLLTPNEAAKRIGMSRSHLCKLLDKEVIPFHRVGTHRKIRLGDLLRFEEKRHANRLELAEKLSAPTKIDRAADEVIASWL